VPVAYFTAIWGEKNLIVTVTKYIYVVFYILGESPASEFYVPTFRITEDRTRCSETSAHKIQALGIRPKERIQHSKYGESLKSRMNIFISREMGVTLIINVVASYIKRAQ
jgi:hypothetical protein